MLSLGAILTRPWQIDVSCLRSAALRGAGLTVQLFRAGGIFFMEKLRCDE